MSPHLRNLLEDAADDGDRPLPLDLAAVRAAGRRATWRQRAFITGGALGAAAVITSIVLVFAPGGAALFGPATGATSGVAEDPGEQALIDALDPLLDAITSRGYDVAIEGSIGSGMASEDGSDPVDVQATVVTVKQGDSVGAAVVTEFTDVGALPLLRDTDPWLADECVVHPVVAADFEWDSCAPSGDGWDYWVATEDDGSAIGVTRLRPDLSGISVALGTAIHDPTRQAPSPPLGALPLTHLELVEVVDQLEARAPLAPSMPPEPTASASALPCFGEDQPPECLPMDGGFVDVEPLITALGTQGLEVHTMAESVAEGTDSAAGSTVLQFAVTDDAGRMGSAAIGVFADVEAARQFGAGSGSGDAAWCAVAPIEEAGYTWNLADDPAAACAGLEPSGVDQIVVVLHSEAGADAIGATLVRSDGSVVSVSVSQEPSNMISAEKDPVDEVPLDKTGILDLLAQLAAANPVT